MVRKADSFGFLGLFRPSKLESQEFQPGIPDLAQRSDQCQSASGRRNADPFPSDSWDYFASEKQESQKSQQRIQKTKVQTLASTTGPEPGQL